MRFAAGLLFFAAWRPIAHGQSGSFQPMFQYSVVPGVCAGQLGLGDTAVVGDFNGDGKLDLAFVCAGTQLAVLLGNDDGTFQSPVLTSLATPVQDFHGNATCVAAADLNGDGKTDLVFTNNQSHQIAAPTCNGSATAPHTSLITMLSLGDGRFAAPSMLPTNSFYAVWSALDLDGDGIPDLLLDNQQYLGIGIMLGKGDGTFSPMTTITASGGTAPLRRRRVLFPCRRA